MSIVEKEISNEPNAWLDWIESGIKTYEGRLNKDFWNEVPVGSFFVLYDSKGKKLKVQVTEKLFFKNFGEAFDKLGQQLIPIVGITRDEVTKLYSEFFSDKSINRFGVVAIGVKPIK